MALLQISEPGLSAMPHERRRAVGIDLGTTNSLVAAVRSGTPEPLPDARGNVILPSVVHYDAGGEVVVGQAAVELAAGAPLDTLFVLQRDRSVSAAAFEAQTVTSPKIRLNIGTAIT